MLDMRAVCRDKSAIGSDHRRFPTWAYQKDRGRICARWPIACYLGQEHTDSVLVIVRAGSPVLVAAVVKNDHVTGDFPAGGLVPYRRPLVSGRKHRQFREVSSNPLGRRRCAGAACYFQLRKNRHLWEHLRGVLHRSAARTRMASINIGLPRNRQVRKQLVASPNTSREAMRRRELKELTLVQVNLSVHPAQAKFLNDARRISGLKGLFIRSHRNA